MAYNEVVIHSGRDVMGVVSGFFRDLADRAGMQQGVSRSLTDALVHNPTAVEGFWRETEARKMTDTKQVAEFRLQGLNDDVRTLGSAFSKFGIPVLLGAHFQQATDDKPAQMTLTLNVLRNQLLEFTATPTENGGYYIQSESNMGAFSCAVREPVADIGAVEKEIVRGLGTALNLSPDNALHVLTYLPHYL